MAGDSLRIEIITRDFDRMLQEFASLDPRIEFRDIVIGVAARVAFSAMGKTKAADEQKIRHSYDEKEYTTFNGKVYKMSNRYPDALWSELGGWVDNKIKIKLAARGLSKQSWYWLGLQLGATGSAPRYVQQANYKGLTFPQNANHSEEGDGGGFALTILNASPIVQAAGGKQALLGAMAGETKYFHRNMENRAFATLESRIKKYPGVYINRGVGAVG